MDKARPCCSWQMQGAEHGRSAHTPARELSLPSSLGLGSTELTVGSQEISDILEMEELRWMECSHWV